MKIVFATNNRKKVEEIQALMPPNIEISTLSEVAGEVDIPETADTLEGNALLKAKFVFENFNLPCFADDTGLEVEALNGRPGVFSARYAGPECNAGDNIKLLLNEMKDQGNRSACFRTVLAYVTEKGVQYFEGRVEGKILTVPTGMGGFGYDPIFQPTGYAKSFAEMSLDEKNKISHRGIAIRKFIASF